MNTRTSTYQSQFNFFVKPLQNQESPFKKCANAYTFSFNGKENVEEINGSGNAMDFGARIYDARLGRFLSIDPLFKQFVSESNYSFAGCSPIGMLDIDGRRKTTYITIINEDNTITKIKLVEKDIVKKAYVPSTVFGISTHDETILEYDIEERITIDNRPSANGKMTSTTVYTERGVFSYLNDLIETDGGKTKVGGGVLWTSNKGQGGETKSAEANFSIEEIDLLLSTIGAAKSGSGNTGIPKSVSAPKKLLDAIKGITQTIKRLNSAAKIGTSISKQISKPEGGMEPKVVCGNCNDTMDLGKVQSWHNQDKLDTIMLEKK